MRSRLRRIRLGFTFGLLACCLGFFGCTYGHRPKWVLSSQFVRSHPKLSGLLSHLQERYDEEWAAHGKGIDYAIYIVDIVSPGEHVRYEGRLKKKDSPGDKGAWFRLALNVDSLVGDRDAAITEIICKDAHVHYYRWQMTWERSASRWRKESVPEHRTSAVPPASAPERVPDEERGVLRETGTWRFEGGRWHYSRDSDKTAGLDDE